MLFRSLIKPCSTSPPTTLPAQLPSAGSSAESRTGNAHVGGFVASGKTDDPEDLLNWLAPRYHHYYDSPIRLVYISARKGFPCGAPSPPLS